MKPILTLCALFLSASITFGADGDKPKGPPDGGRRNPEEMFKRLDTNNDGAISKEEFLESPRAKQDPDKAAKRFEDLDKDKDGKLDKKEIAAGGDRRGKKGGPGDRPGPKPEGDKPDEKKPEAK